MTSCDTNILVYAYNRAAPEHALAMEFLRSNLENKDFALSELILIEFYVLIRNPAVFQKPLGASDATGLVRELRANPYWTILRANTDVSEAIWNEAEKIDFPRRAVFDARVAYSLAAEGVHRFATRNTSDFDRFGVFEVFDPLAQEP